MSAAEIPPVFPSILQCRQLARVVLAAIVSPALPWAQDSLPLEASPLAPRSVAEGPTLFTAMPAEATGIVSKNDYADPAMWSDRNKEFDIGAIGSGIAIGDYDGDGRPDLFVVSKIETCRLFRNLGDWKFADVTADAGFGEAVAESGVWKQGATFADVNNDGWLDLYICRSAAPNLLYINQGDGTFSEEAAVRGLAVVDASSQAAFADFNRDGWLDVYLQTNLLDSLQSPEGQADYLFVNNGDGTFTDVTAAAGISGETQGHAAIWWDYDVDGWPDLYVANDFGPVDNLYRNNGDGTFRDVVHQAAPHVPYSSMGADLGDVNNDGFIDFLASEMAALTRAKDHRGMVDSRARGQAEVANQRVALQFMRNALFLGTGTTRLREAAHLSGLAATDWTWSPRFEDLDNDGWLDLHVTNGMYRELNNEDIMSRQMRTESLPARTRIMRSSPVLAENNLAFRNRGDLTFEEVGAAWGLDQLGVSFGSAFGDLDGDGDLDLAFTNYQSGVTVLRNDSASGHRITIALRGVESNRFGVGAQVRIETAAGPQVRSLVLARGYLASSQPVLHFGLGEQEEVSRLVVTWPSGLSQSFERLPADHHFVITEEETPTLDFASSSTTSELQFDNVSRSVNFIHQSRGFEVDELSNQPLLPRRNQRVGPALAVGDLTGDGLDDVVMAGTLNDPVRLLRGQRDGAFTEVDARALADSLPLNDGPVLLFDADGNGTTDLLRTKGGASLPAGVPLFQPSLWLNAGEGRLRKAPNELLPDYHQSAGSAVAADFDRDGRLDVFLGGRVKAGEYPVSPRSALWRNSGRGFEDVTARLAPGLAEVGLVSAALWTDVDDDGWIDLLVALEWGPVRYWRNQAGRGFVDESKSGGFSAGGFGWWTSLAAADFNGDGRMDYVAGNIGLNTQYRASPEHPALLLRGDFAGTGEPRLVEATFEAGKWVPWRGRRQLAAAIPPLARKFRSSDQFAQSDLTAIFGNEALQAAQQFVATEFRSGVFMSTPAGSHVFQSLPMSAQLSPLQGIVAGDADGDGRADIVAVQNSTMPIPLVGREHGDVGLVLRGNGAGGFTALPLRETNFLVPRDAEALVLTDFDHDGWPDYLLSRHEDTTMALRGVPIDGREFLRVQLAGSAGNPRGVGARVTLHLTGGLKQTAEVSAGSSYLSQSTTALFFGYERDNPPDRLTVRWPSGQVDEHDARDRAGSWVVSQSAD